MSSGQKTQFTVRPARPADRTPCLDLDHSFDTQLVWQLQHQQTDERISLQFQTVRLPRAVRVEYPRNRDELERDLASLEGVLIAEAEGIVLGYIQIWLTPSDGSAWIRNFAVGAPWRRRRIGRILFAQGCDWAQLQQAKHITAEATTKNYPAIRFLQGQGLIFCGFNDRHYPSQDIAVFFGQNL